MIMVLLLSSEISPYHYQWPSSERLNTNITQRCFIFGTTVTETAHVTGRAISTNCLSGIRRIDYHMITAPGNCNSSMPVHLQYDLRNDGQWISIEPSKSMN